jgi:transcriptional regulator with XRE-family HTH domain
LLQAIRVGEDMSQAEFALRLGVSKSHICDIEKGRKSVSPMRALEFARILKYSDV